MVQTLSVRLTVLATAAAGLLLVGGTRRGFWY